MTTIEQTSAVSLRSPEDWESDSSRSGSSPRQARQSLPSMQVTATMRDLTRADGAAVDTIFAGLSAHSRYRRFHAGAVRLTDSLRELLTYVDGHDCVGVIAEVATAEGLTPIAMAHLVRLNETCGEVAVVVVDAYQRRGVGRRLLETLGERAVDLGYQVIVAHVLPENDDALRFAHQTFPGVLSQRRDDLVELRYHLSVAQDWEAEILSALRCH